MSQLSIHTNTFLILSKCFISNIHTLKNRSGATRVTQHFAQRHFIMQTGATRYWTTNLLCSTSRATATSYINSYKQNKFYTSMMHAVSTFLQSKSNCLHSIIIMFESRANDVIWLGNLLIIMDKIWQMYIAFNVKWTSMLAVFRLNCRQLSEGTGCSINALMP